jgi:hypothetical protein
MGNPRFNGAKIDYQESQKNPEKMGRKPPENLPKTVASPFESGRVPRMGKIESQAFPKNHLFSWLSFRVRWRQNKGVRYLGKI